MNVKEIVFSTVASVCEVSIEQVTEQSTVGDFPSWDSMAQLSILQKVEETLNISFDPEELMEMEDISDIIKTAESKL